MMSEKKSKSFLLVSPDYPPQKGGVEIYSHNLNALLIKHGHDIKVFSGTRLTTPKCKADYEFEGVCVHKKPTFKFFGMDFPRSVFSYFQLFKLIQTSQIVLINDSRCFTLSSLFFCWCLRKKVFLFTHGLIFHTKRNLMAKKTYLYLLLKFLPKNVSIISTSTIAPCL